MLVPELNDGLAIEDPKVELEPKVVLTSPFVAELSAALRPFAEVPNVKEVEGLAEGAVNRLVGFAPKVEVGPVDGRAPSARVEAPKANVLGTLEEEPNTKGDGVGASAGADMDVLRTGVVGTIDGSAETPLGVTGRSRAFVSLERPRFSAVSPDWSTLETLLLEGREPKVGIEVVSKPAEGLEVDRLADPNGAKVGEGLTDSEVNDSICF